MGKKVLITGGSGLLGRALVSKFAEKSWDVLGLAFSRAKDKLVKVDLTDFESVRKVAQDFKPDVIIHSAAQRSPDKVENEYEKSYKLNVLSAEKLACLAGEMQSFFLLISTDYVFDGSNPPYKEADKPNPINQYGKTKAEAEKAVLKVNKDACILRIPILYGNEEYVSESAISSLLVPLMDSSSPKKMSDYEIRFPSHTNDIATICCDIAERQLEDPSVKSIYQWCGSESLTKYAMVNIVADVFNLSASHVVPELGPSPGAPRPKNTQLSCERLNHLGIGCHTPFRTGILCFKKFLDKHV